jgi:hypothetical protein
MSADSPKAAPATHLREWLERMMAGELPNAPVAQLVGMRLVRMEKGVAVAEKESLVARASSTCLVLRGEMAAGR